MEYQRNLPLLYVITMFLKRAVMPILALYFLLNKLSFTEIGILGSVMAIVFMLAEVPTGIFTDRYGRKASLIIHGFLAALTMFLYWIGDSFWYFLTASVVYGVASAFISGTRQALIFDTLKVMKKTKDFKKQNGAMMFYGHLFNAFVLLLIPVLYSYDPKLPFLVGILFGINCVIISSFLKEPPLAKEHTNPYAHLKESLSQITPSVLSPFLLMTVIGSFFWMSVDFLPPLLELSRLDIIYFGLVYFSMRILKGVAAALTYKVEKFTSSWFLILLGALLVIIGFFGMSLGTGMVIIGGMIMTRFAEGINRITLEDELNQQISSKHRATVMSLNMLSQQICAALIVLLVGIGADYLGLQESFFLASILMTLLIGGVLLLFMNVGHLKPAK